MDLTSQWAGILSLVVFAAAYVLVICEEITHMRKSKPVMLAAGVPIPTNARPSVIRNSDWEAVPAKKKP